MDDLLQVQIHCPFKCLPPNLFQSLHFIYLLFWNSFFEFEFSVFFRYVNFLTCMKFSFDLDETSYARIFLLLNDFTFPLIFQGHPYVSHCYDSLILVSVFYEWEIVYRWMYDILLKVHLSPGILQTVCLGYRKETVLEVCWGACAF